MDSVGEGGIQGDCKGAFVSWGIGGGRWGFSGGCASGGIGKLYEGGTECTGVKMIKFTFESWILPNAIDYWTL